ncbi:nicotinate-nucleotide--dimethylbenzimidazole phosphoribosyltransferase [Roseovarius sp. 217]|uniref:nicotinate-nucleotide--dimethylbenzimidazole phosphoribosyltransferase n=1 Tax=Roseovarius sp. (strain 217) TaxID=314264 RepID=UPI0000685E76|nr:nicotinate-nucleotide--dimethylbenzimidazole phosphoribosyltransferase [Roseovarius sp. 217]EAQ22813.1 nicotinate-nucleotide--dimethylbenzimidazolephosphoribosyltransferase [Roseovarius sp. 217]
MAGAFSSLSDFAALLGEMPGPDPATMIDAQARDAQLTKPPGALGRLEGLAVWYCGWRGEARARVTAPQVIVFAGNHGVVAQGVSAFPAEVTAQMVANFRAGGAAVNQMAAQVGARMDVHALDLDRPTGDISLGPAMSKDEMLLALSTGWDAVDPASDLLVVGEMGIGNTTSAAAIALALHGGEAAAWTGRGTGLADAALVHKAQIVAQAVAINAASGAGGLEVLRRLGGRELVAMAGAIARARSLRIPVVLDGFICTAAAACLEAECAGALGHTVAGHVSAEPGHARLLQILDKVPLLSLDLRLGEGSGGVLAMSVVQAALACHSGMATFAEAGVTGA